MPEKYHIKTQPVPPRRPRIGKYGVVDWREDCARCHNCVKKACVYDRYRQEAEYIRNLSDVDALFFDCMGCFSCVQDCTKGLLCMSINPAYEKLGNSYWTPYIIKTTWLQAETAKIPVSGAGYQGPFAGYGFDSMWTDMSEIVRPTRDGIHGREYISTSVDIGRKLPYLDFDGDKAKANPPNEWRTSLPHLASIPMPLIIDMSSPAHTLPQLDAIITQTAVNTGLIAIIDSRHWSGDDKQLEHIAFYLGPDSADIPKEALRKTRLVKMAIARARLLIPLEGGTLKVDQTGIVIGGGLSGMTAALALANQGFKVHLVERADRLGGTLHDIYHTLEHNDIAKFTDALIKQVEKHPNINLYLGTEIAGIAGHIGKFKMALVKDGNNFEVSGGAIIVATGARQAQTTEFMYGQSDRVLTQVELEKLLHDNAYPAKGQNVVMIQCVGSRNDEHPYCSRICCSMAIKNAIEIKKRDPNANVFVLYRDVRTYGFRETYYKQARQAGVVFIRYTPDAPPQVSQDNGLVVTLKSPDLPELIEIEADNVVLSTGVEADRENNNRISDMLKVPLNADGFYVEAHMKLRPVDFATEGIFLCGLAHSPKFIDENISQARAAAARAATVLSKTHLDVSAQVSYVDQQKCISCMTCVNCCPYSAPFCNKDGKGQIEAAKCMGCGICASECPARAIQLHHFETDQFMVMIRQLFAGGNGEMFAETPSKEKKLMEKV